MGVNDVITNTWVVAVVSVVAALAVLRWAGEWVLCARGALTGTYIALTQTDGTQALLTEIVRCRHIGQRVKGNIAARARLTLGGGGNVEQFVPVAATYQFAGRVRARQVVLSYWSAPRASHHGGAMTMVLDAKGMAFQGIWCGMAPDGQVMSGPCLWIKASDDAVADLDTGQLAARVESALRLIANPWRKIGAPPIRLDKLLGDAAARDALQRVREDGVQHRGAHRARP